VEGRDGMGKASKAKLRANAKYNAKTYEKVSFDSRKEYRLTELVNYAAALKKISKAQYIESAIQSQLAHDGITIDMLPVDSKYIPPAETKQAKQYMIYLVTEWMEDDSEWFELDVDDSDDIAVEDFDFDYRHEDYVSIFQTLKAAKDYIRNKFKRKAHPEKWGYTIYGRVFEANTKRDAYDMYREMAQEALEKVEKSLIDAEADDGGAILDFVRLLKDEQEPDYVEDVKYEEDGNEQG